MDRAWIIKGVRKLSLQHLQGVEKIMQHVRGRFAKDARILFPCSTCLNTTERAQGTVEDHLLLNWMASTYDRWIHHGEPLHSEPDAHADHGDDGIEFMEKVLQENAGLEEEDGYEDDRIPALLKDLYDSEDHVDESKSMFAEVLEDAKHATHDGGKFSRFSFTVKLLHVKSYYQISNAAFNAILHLLNLQYPNSSVPKHYDEALSII
jgi:hypothetical protein